MVAGCTGTAPQADTGSVGRTVTGTTATSVATAGPASLTGTIDAGSGSTAGQTSGGKGADITGADLAAIRKQLDAMQKEIDSLALPTDNDFSGAEGAVY
jgi:hypothetical protein